MTEIVAPNYGRGSFADLPALIRHCLTGEAVAMPATAQWGAYLRPTTLSFSSWSARLAGVF